MAESVAEGPFVPDFHMPSLGGPAAGCGPVGPLGVPCPPVALRLVRLLCLQCPVMGLEEVPGYVRAAVASASTPEPPQLVVLPSDVWGTKPWTALRKCRVMQELCQVASATGATLVVPGIWEGPRLDGTCYQTTAVVTPWWEPSVVVGAGGPSTGPSPVPGPTVGHVAGPGSAVSPSSGPSGGGAPGEGAATPAPPGPPLVDVSEAVTLYHHRTVVGDVQVPGVFPGCVPSPCGVLGLLPDLDVTNGVFVKEVAELGAHLLLHPASGDWNGCGLDSPDSEDEEAPDGAVLFTDEERLELLQSASALHGVALVHCEPCVPFGSGRSFVTVGGTKVAAAPTTGPCALVVSVPLFAPKGLAT